MMLRRNRFPIAGGFSETAFPRVILFALCISFLIGTLSHSFGCGLDWSLPTNHFEGVNEHGYVSYWEKVGEVDLGDDLKLPININFRSNRETISPYLGKSFLLALLESNIVQTGDNSFMATFPDGSLNLFIRNNPNETVLEGSAGWKGEIRGDVIDAYASCGWKLSFYRGHIQTLSTPKNRKLEFIRSGNVVTEIRENGAARLTVERESAGAVKALLFNGKRMEIALDQKPRVQTIAGQNVVGGIDRSLRSLTPTDGPSKSFEFAVNDKLQPTLKITSKANTERLFTWDPATKRIISDNDWTYQITTPNGSLANAAIGRTNANKQSEFWFYDGAKGQEITQGIDGVKKVTSWFVSGIVSGRLRKIDVYINSSLRSSYKAIYDENGRLSSELEDDRVKSLYKRSNNGDEEQIDYPLKNLKVISKKQGTLCRVNTYHDDTLEASSVFSNGELLRKTFNDGRQEEYDVLGRIKSNIKGNQEERFYYSNEYQVMARKEQGIIISKILLNIKNNAGYRLLFDERKNLAKCMDFNDYVINDKSKIDEIMKTISIVELN